MIHTFKCMDRYYLLDVDTCSLFEIDEMAMELCPYVQSGESYDRLYDKYEERELDETYGELMSLKEQGLAFTDKDWTSTVINPGHELKAMCLHVSHDCELRCRYCFASTGSFHGERSLMDADTGKKALEFLAQHSGSRKNLEVDFFGGEPLLNYEVVKEIIKYGKEVLEKKYDKQFRFTITTNGMKLNEEILKDFDEMYNVVISIDGRTEVHNYMRPDEHGDRTYSKIVNNGLNLKDSRNGKSYYVRGTFTSNNLDFSSDVLHLADLGFDQISMEPVVLDEKSKFAIKEEHLPVIFSEYEKLAKEYIKRRQNKDTWFNYFHFMIDMECGPCITKRLTGCGAGNEYIAVTPKGEIYPCHQFVGNDSYEMGSVIDGSFDTNMQQAFSKNHVLSKPECSECWCKFFCSGGCAANAVNFNGEMFEPYKLSCEMQKKRTECALAIYSIEKENNMEKNHKEN